MLTIVMGPSCAGKSTYIKEHFPNEKVIDVFDFQDYRFATPETVWQSYEDCAKALQDALKENENVVLEHTLLKAIRREWYIQKVREVSDCDIKVICIFPSLKMLQSRSRKRKCISTADYCQAMLDTLELPQKEEGYSEVEIVRVEA